MTIDKIDLNKLKSYSGKTTQSFEQLIYWLMKNEYEDLGKFTLIDGGGGDSGVEFYLDLKNGDRWGWQCKWYPDNGRLSQSSRKKSIEDSLVTACTNHKNLTKWFLCLRSDLTVSMTTKKGEREWFEEKLPLKVPLNMSVEIDFIGETQIINFIGAAKNHGLRNFFFGELEFNQEWFAKRFQDSFEQVKDKYEPDLHTADDFLQSIIDFKLLNSSYELILDSCIQKLVEIERNICENLKEWSNLYTSNKEAKSAKEKWDLVFGEFEEYKLNVYNFFDNISRNIRNCDIDLLKKMNLDSEHKMHNDYLSRLNPFTNVDEGSAYPLLQRIYYSIKSFFDEFERFTRNYIHPINNEIHLIGDPALGKTHTSCDIAYKRISNGQAAIFLTGNKFNHEADLEHTILKQLDIPQTFSFEDLLKALDFYGALTKVRIPLIIDGLNETVYNKGFSSIWRTHLPTLVSKINRLKNVVLITTCRKSYQMDVWKNPDVNSFAYLNGFNDYEVTREAIDKYFKRYHIKADIIFSNIDSFKNPLFLKLYCELKNPQWQHGIDVEVILEDDSSNTLFDKYFNQINSDVSLNSQLIRKNELFVQNSLRKIAKYLWENNTREITLDDYYELIDGTIQYNSETSKADILINEGLIITRDCRNSNEFVSITYELMSGYVIAKYLIENCKIEDFLPGSTFHERIKVGESQHPLYENILDEIVLLFPKHKDMMLHHIYDLDEDVPIHNTSLKALWKIESKYIAKSDIELVSSYFGDSVENRKTIIQFCQSTITNTTHPFNMSFLSKELLELQVWERDLSWTEYIRQSVHSLLLYIEEFENECKNGVLESEISLSKLHLAANYIKWFLTSTHRQLRDYSTRALYYYGRRFHKNFLEMVFQSLKYNDPYIWERTLAALYGVCMAMHTDTNFKQNILGDIAVRLYENFFIEDALYYSTHILARDYARGCIRIALIHNTNILDKSEISRVTPPYDLIEDQLKMIRDDEDITYRKPLGIDFSNYTIGSIVKGGHSHNNPIAKQNVRRQILYRIEQIGWTEERFITIDSILSRNNRSRSERPKIERYGKKYSWIAFYEIAGYLDDKGDLDKEFQNFRISSTDIDSSFPDKVKTNRFIFSDFLGDRSTNITDWLLTDDFPRIEPYLQHNLIENKQFVCLDGFIKQDDPLVSREHFIFIRSFIVSDIHYDRLIKLIKKQNLGRRWLPEKRENTDAFAGENYLFEEATYSNKTTLEFILSSSEKIVKRGEEGYYPDVEFENSDDGSFSIVTKYPESKTITISDKEEIEVLMPVMTYHSPSNNIGINEASSTTILAKEIAIDLGLIGKPQSFDLFDVNGLVGCKNIEYIENSSNTHNMVFLRKDLLNEYLTKNNLRFFWAVWGERGSSDGYQSMIYNNEDGNNTKEPFEFDKIIEYF